MKQLKCERCPHKGPDWQFNRHHKDRDRSNDSPENIEVLCIPCHRAEHSRLGTSSENSKTARIELRCADAMKAAWEDAAASEARRVSDWARRVLNEAAGFTESGSSAAGSEPVGERQGRQPGSVKSTCRRSSTHRKGVYCKACGRTP